MLQLTNNTISSLELVEQINLFRAIEREKEPLNRLYANTTHDSLLKIIRDEFSEEMGVSELNETSYKHPQNGQTYPMFNLTTSQAKQVLVRESKIVRKAVISYIEKLEALVKPKSQVDILIESVMILKSHETRLDVVELKLNSIEASQKIAVDNLTSLEGSTQTVPEIGIRLKCSQIVRNYAEKHKIAHQLVWRTIYSKMIYTYRFSVNNYKKLKTTETKLDIVEREGQLDNLYALITKELL